MSRFRQHRQARSGLRRPSWLATSIIAAAALLISVVLEQHGVKGKYSETGFGTLILLWGFVSAFRSEWRRVRFWVILVGILAAHLAAWIYLAARIERFGFALMFVLLIVEFALGATLISKAIPEDEQAMLEHIDRW